MTLFLGGCLCGSALLSMLAYSCASNMLLSLAPSAHFTLQKLLNAVFVRIAVQAFSRGVFLLESSA